MTPRTRRATPLDPLRDKVATVVHLHNRAATAVDIPLRVATVVLHNKVVMAAALLLSKAGMVALNRAAMEDLLLSKVVTVDHRSSREAMVHLLHLRGIKAVTGPSPCIGDVVMGRRALCVHVCVCV